MNLTTHPLPANFLFFLFKGGERHKSKGKRLGAGQLWKSGDPGCSEEQLQPGSASVAVQTSVLSIRHRYLQPGSIPQHPCSCCHGRLNAVLSGVCGGGGGGSSFRRLLALYSRENSLPQSTHYAFHWKIVAQLQSAPK